MTTRILLLLLLPELVACAARTSDDEIRASGTVEVTEVRVAARTPGQVRSLFVREGDRVAQGDTLAVIEHDLLILQLRQADAAAAAAAAQLALLRKGARSEDVAQARAQLEQADVLLAQARQDAERLRKLGAAGSVTQKQVDDAEARLAVVQSQRQAAAQAVEKVRNLARPEEIQVAEAHLAQAQAQRDVLSRQIADAFITAPIAGVVTDRMIEEGELVGPGSALLNLADLSRAYLRIYVPEPSLGRIQTGQSVDVFTDTYPDRPFEGRVVFISPEAEFTPKNVQTRAERVKLVYRVRIEVPNPEGILKPGMYGDVVVYLEGR